MIDIVTYVMNADFDNIIKIASDMDLSLIKILYERLRRISIAMDLHGFLVINIVSDNVNGMHKCRYYNDTMDVIDNKIEPIYHSV